MFNPVSCKLLVRVIARLFSPCATTSTMLVFNLCKINIDWKEKPDNGKPSIRIAVAASHLDPLLEQVNV
jgi:hypothetical protein